MAPAKNFDIKIVFLDTGFVTKNHRVPIDASPETKSPVTSATRRGTCMISFWSMMKATRFPFNILPLKLKVCSNDEVTKEIKLSPSAFIAIKITAINMVKAPKPI